MISDVLVTLRDSDGDPSKMPAKCTQPNDHGQLPTCTLVGSTWQVTYPDAPRTGTSGTSDAGGWALLFVLVLLGGLAFTAWKVSTARRMARDAGMSERDATAMTLFSDDGFEAT